LCCGLLVHVLAQRVGRIRPGRVLLVDRQVGRGLVEGQPEHRLARRPHHVANPGQAGGREHVVGLRVPKTPSMCCDL
jgi:hypothetical protein